MITPEEFVQFALNAVAPTLADYFTVSGNSASITNHPMNKPKITRMSAHIEPIDALSLAKHSVKGVHGILEIFAHDQLIANYMGYQLSVFAHPATCGHYIIEANALDESGANLTASITLKTVLANPYDKFSIQKTEGQWHNSFFIQTNQIDVLLTAVKLSQ